MSINLLRTSYESFQKLSKAQMPFALAGWALSLQETHAKHALHVNT